MSKVGGLMPQNTQTQSTGPRCDDAHTKGAGGAPGVTSGHDWDIESDLEPRVLERLGGRGALGGVVLEHVSHELDTLRTRVGDDLYQRRSDHLRELKVHALRQLEAFGPVLLRRRPHHRADFEDFVRLRAPGEQGSEGIEFGHHTAHGPHVDRRVVPQVTEQDLGGTVPAKQSGRERR